MNLCLLEFFNTSAIRAPDDKVKYSIADGIVPREFGKVAAVRIMSHAESQNWVIINEVRVDEGVLELIVTIVTSELVTSH